MHVGPGKLFLCVIGGQILIRRYPHFSVVIRSCKNRLSTPRPTGASETLTVHYLAALGGYRLFYVLNWARAPVSMSSADMRTVSEFQRGGGVPSHPFVLFFDGGSDRPLLPQRYPDRPLGEYLESHIRRFVPAVFEGGFCPTVPRSRFCLLGRVVLSIGTFCQVKFNHFTPPPTMDPPTWSDVKALVQAG